MIRAVFLSLAFLSASAIAQTVEIELLNGLTREKKKFEFGTYKFDIPVNFVKGWNKCTALPIKNFTFSGNDAVRGDLYCSSNQNTSVNISCVATKLNKFEVSITTLYGGKFQFMGDGSIASDSFADITIMCRH
jgi:hypothetical protein